MTRARRNGGVSRHAGNAAVAALTAASMSCALQSGTRRLTTIEGAPPDITKRELETPVTLPDSHTVILGGLVTNNTLDTLSKTPWLGDLPLIGWLFRSTRDETRDRYLYVFITPHIIDEGDMTMEPRRTP